MKMKIIVQNIVFNVDNLLYSSFEVTWISVEDLHFLNIHSVSR